jgi:hypothetical protein
MTKSHHPTDVITISVVEIVFLFDDVRSIAIVRDQVIVHGVSAPVSEISLTI